MAGHFEKKLESKEIFLGHVFDVLLDTVELENGRTATREVVRHNGGAGILAVNDKGQVALVRQFRYATGREVLEIPAGKIEKGEDPRETAIRELTEEVGCTADTFRELGRMIPTSGYCTEIIYLYFATDLQPAKQQLDADEFLTVFWMDFEEALQKVISGEIIDGKTIVALFRYKYNLDNCK